MNPVLIVVALAIGTMIGYVGIGGVFLVPALIAIQGLSTKEAIGTALASFVVAGVAGTGVYAWQRRIDWRLATLTAAAGVPFAPAGARVAAALPAPLLQAAFALFLGISGAVTLWTSDRGAAHAVTPDQTAASTRGAQRSVGMVGRALVCGAVAGFGAGLLGIGGPAILVPLLLLSGVPAVLAVGASQLSQVTSSLSGAVGHLVFGRADLSLAAALSVWQGLGVCLGAYLSFRAGSTLARPRAGGACLLVAGWITLGLLRSV